MPAYTPPPAMSKFFTDQQLKDIKEYAVTPNVPYIKARFLTEEQRKEKDVDIVILRTVDRILKDYNKEKGWD